MEELTRVVAGVSDNESHDSHAADSEEDEIPSNTAKLECLSVFRSVLQNYGGLNEACSKALYACKRAVRIVK